MRVNTFFLCEDLIFFVVEFFFLLVFFCGCFFFLFFLFFVCMFTFFAPEAHLECSDLKIS